MIYLFEIYDAEGKLPVFRDPALLTFVLCFSPCPLRCYCVISGFDRILLVFILNIGIQLKTKFSLSSALKILAFPLAL